MEMTKVGDRVVTFDNAETIEISTFGKTYQVEAGQAVFFEDEGEYRILYQPEGAQVPTQFKISVTGYLACDDAYMAVVSRAEQLDRVRKNALAEANRQCGLLRAQFITVAPGKDMEYQEKYRLCLAYEDDNTIDMGMVASEAEIEGMSLDDKVDQILAKRDAWAAVAKLTNDTVTQYKVDLDAAKTESEIMEVIMAFAWPEGLPVEVLS